MIHLITKVTVAAGVTSLLVPTLNYNVLVSDTKSELAYVNSYDLVPVDQNISDFEITLNEEKPINLAFFKNYQFKKADTSAVISNINSNK